MKIISVLLALIFCISLCGCKKTAEDTSSIPVVTATSKAQSTAAEDVSSVQSKEGSISSVESKFQTAEVGSKAQTSVESSMPPSTYENPKVCTHNFTSSTVSASCTTDGYITKTCTLCGYTTEKTVIKATGHNMVSGKCTACGYADVTECRNRLSDWLKANGSGTYGEYYLSDNRYYFKTSGGGNIYFHFEDGNNGSIIVSIYGWEKNKCYIEYIYTALENIEGEFPMDEVHSSNRTYFNQMNGTVDGERKEQLIAELRSKIDGVLLKFQEVMQSNVGVSLKDIGFTAY